MSVFKKPCLRCGQEVRTDDNGKVGFHAVAGRKGPGQGS